MAKIVIFLILLCMAMGYAQDPPAAVVPEAEKTGDKPAPDAAAAKPATDEAAAAAKRAPAGTAQPAAAAKPAGTAQPAATAKPAGTAQPAAAAKPAGTAKPATDKASGSTGDKAAPAGGNAKVDNTNEKTNKTALLKKFLKMPPAEIAGIVAAAVAAVFLSAQTVMCAKYKKGLLYMAQLKMKALAGYAPVAGGDAPAAAAPAAAPAAAAD